MLQVRSEHKNTVKVVEHVSEFLLHSDLCKLVELYFKCTVVR